jgi:hypothetical protein
MASQAGLPPRLFGSGDKEADLLVIRAPVILIFRPSNDAIGTVVQSAKRSNVDTAMIGGRARKFAVLIAGLDMKGVKAMAGESNGRLFAAARRRLDIAAASCPTLNRG